MSHTCRQPLKGSSSGQPRPCPLQGRYPQGPINSLWAVTPRLCQALCTEVEQEGHPDRAAGESAAKESAGVAAEKREKRNGSGPTRHLVPQSQDSAAQRSAPAWALSILVLLHRSQQRLQTQGKNPRCHAVTAACLALLWGWAGLTTKPTWMDFTFFSRAWLHLVSVHEGASVSNLAFCPQEIWMKLRHAGSFTVSHYRKRYIGLYNPLFYKRLLKISSCQGRLVPAANPLIVATLPGPSSPWQHWLIIPLLELKCIKAPNTALSLCT